jgi:hypothetical protein
MGVCQLIHAIFRGVAGALGLGAGLGFGVFESSIVAFRDQATSQPFASRCDGDTYSHLM